MTEYFIFGFQPDPFKDLENRLLDGTYTSRFMGDRYVSGANDTITDEKTGFFSDSVLALYSKTEEESTVLEDYVKSITQHISQIKNKQDFLNVLSFVTTSPLEIQDTRYPSILYATDHVQTMIQFEYGCASVQTTCTIITDYATDNSKAFTTWDGKKLDARRLPAQNYSCITHTIRTDKNSIQSKISYLYPLSELKYSS